MCLQCFLRGLSWLVGRVYGEKNGVHTNSRARILASYTISKGQDSILTTMSLFIAAGGDRS